MPIENIEGKNHKTAVISDDFTGIETDIAIYKPKDYSLGLPESFLQSDSAKYLYYPAFATSNELDKIAEWLEIYDIDGIYAENYGLLPFAGSDNHAGSARKLLGGMESPTPIKDEADFAARVLSGEIQPFILNTEEE